MTECIRTSKTDWYWCGHILESHLLWESCIVHICMEKVRSFPDPGAEQAKLYCEKEQIDFRYVHLPVHPDIITKMRESIQRYFALLTDLRYWNLRNPDKCSWQVFYFTPFGDIGASASVPRALGHVHISGKIGMTYAWGETIKYWALCLKWTRLIRAKHFFWCLKALSTHLQRYQCTLKEIECRVQKEWKHEQWKLQTCTKRLLMTYSKTYDIKLLFENLSRILQR